MPSLADVRAQFPQYNDMSDQQLSDALHSKFYSDMSKDEFEKKISQQPPTFANGQQFGFSDELKHAATASLARPIYAATAAIGPALKGEGFGQAYTKAEQEYDAARAAYEKGSPVASTAGSVLGGIASLGGAGGAGLPATFLGRIGQGAATGAAYGGISGAANSNGDIGNRAYQAGEGALLGGGIGAAIPGAIDVGRVATAPVRSIISAARNPEGAAIRQISQAMTDAGITPQDAARSLAEAHAAGVRDMTLADVLGRNVAQRTATYAKVPGPAKEAAMDFLEQRAASRPENIVDVARQSLGHPEQTYNQIDQLTAARTANSAPAYNRAFQEGDQAIWSPQLERLSSSPSVQAAMHSAVNRWTDNVIADGYGAMNPGTMVSRGGQLQFLNGKVPAFPNLQFWDYTKRALDDMVRGALRDSPDKARTLTRLVQQLRGELDAAAPSYRAARAAYGEPSRSLEAIEAGRQFLQMPAEEIQRTLAGFAPPDQDLARLGAIRALQEITGRGGDQTARLLSGNMRDRMAEIFPDQQSYQRAINAWQIIRQQNNLGRKVLGGSPTFENFADAGDARLDPMILAHAASGNFHGATMGALRGLANRFGGITPEIANSGVNMLLNPNPVAQLTALQRMRDSGIPANALASERRRVANQLITRGFLGSQLNGNARQ